jgi:hypothetical protein
MKREFFAVYNYGMGALCAIVRASSAAEVRNLLPPFKVYDERPEWLTDDDLKRIRPNNTFDVDGELPEWVKSALDESK